MNILVIGASGFIGKNIALTCIRKGWKVYGTYYKHKSSVPKECGSLHVSSIDKLKNNYDIVYLAIGNFGCSYDELIEANVKIPLKVIKKFTKSRIVFLSSTEVYGIHKEQITEESSFNSPGIYGLSKISGEFIVRSFPNASVARLTYIYGTGMNDNLFIPRAVWDAKTKKTISIFGDGKRMQNYLYVKDAVEYCLEIGLYKKTGIFLCTNNKSYSNLNIAKIIQSEFDGCKIIFRGEDRSPSFLFNNTKTNNLLRFSPKYSFEDGSKNYIAQIK